MKQASCNNCTQNLGNITITKSLSHAITLPVSSYQHVSVGNCSIVSAVLIVHHYYDATRSMTRLMVETFICKWPGIIARIPYQPLCQHWRAQSTQVLSLKYYWQYLFQFKLDTSTEISRIYCSRHYKWPISTSASFLAELSVRSPRKLFIFII